jgi:hypothetical protein
VPYVFRTVAVASIYLTIHFSVCLFLSSPISAEYWVRELLVVKEKLADSISSSPRVIFLGGSSALFGIDAQEVAAETGLPTMNMGLHAGMRLDRVLSAGEDVVRRGDVLVLPLEYDFYSCDQKAWSDWQLRNALAWDRSYFDSLSLGTRIKAVFEGGGPGLMMDLLSSKLASIADPGDYAGRLETLAPAEVIWARYSSGKLRTNDFSYSAYNIDDRGDMLGNEGADYSGLGVPANKPNNICVNTLSTFINFVARMKHKEVRVLVAHTPYLIENSPTPNWPDAEENFLRDIASIGAEVLDHRQELFFPRSYFFNTELHLNDLGRREWTKTLIANLKELSIGQSATVIPRAGH